MGTTVRRSAEWSSRATCCALRSRLRQMVPPCRCAARAANLISTRCDRWVETWSRSIACARSTKRHRDVSRYKSAKIVDKYWSDVSWRGAWCSCDRVSLWRGNVRFHALQTANCLPQINYSVPTALRMSLVALVAVYVGTFYRHASSRCSCRIRSVFFHFCRRTAWIS